MKKFTLEEHRILNSIPYLVKAKRIVIHANNVLVRCENRHYHSRVQLLEKEVPVLVDVIKSVSIEKWTSMMTNGDEREFIRAYEEQEKIHQAASKLLFLPLGPGKMKMLSTIHFLSGDGGKENTIHMIFKLRFLLTFWLFKLSKIDPLKYPIMDLSMKILMDERAESVIDATSDNEILREIDGHQGDDDLKDCFLMTMHVLKYTKTVSREELVRLACKISCFRSHQLYPDPATVFKFQAHVEDLF